MNNLKYFMLTIIISYLLTGVAKAEDLYIGMFTSHLPLSCGNICEELNEDNHLIAVQLDSGFVLGSMTNSFNKPSMLFGWMSQGTISIGILGATGYSGIYLMDHLVKSPIIPMPVAKITLPLNDTVSFGVVTIAGLIFNGGFQISY